MPSAHCWPAGWRPRRPTVPAEIRRPFVIAGISAFVAWAVTGLFLSLIPLFVATVLGHENLLLAGVVVSLMLAPSAVIQLAGRRLESLRAQVAGLVVMLSGVTVLLISDAGRSLSLLITATVLAGLVQGLSFMGSLGDVGEIAPPLLARATLWPAITSWCTSRPRSRPSVSERSPRPRASRPRSRSSPGW